MMVMKKLLLLLSVLLLQSAVKAEGYKYLTFETSGGEQQSIPTENLNITFADGMLSAVAGDAMLSYQVADLGKMFFSMNDAAVGIVDAGADSPFVVYSVTGMAYGTFDTVAAARRALVPGIYVLRYENGATRKIAVK